MLRSFPQLLPAVLEMWKDSLLGFAVNDAGNVMMPSMIMMIMLGSNWLIMLFANTTAACCNEGKFILHRWSGYHCRVWCGVDEQHVYEQ
jgi:hypothetical protein